MADCKRSATATVRVVNPEERAQALALAEELLTDIELDQLPVDKQVLKASRLARIVGDEKVIEWLNKERVGYTNADYGKYGWSETFRGADKDKPMHASTMQLASMVKTLEAEMSNMNLPNVSGEWASVTVRETRNHIASIRNQVLLMRRVLAATSTLVHDFASRQYHALKFSHSQQQLFERAKSNIDALLEALDVNTLRKIDSAQSNLRAGDPEAIAAAMLNVRRLIDGFADSVFPPTDEVRTNGNGQEIRLGSEQRLNRVKAYVDDRVSSATRGARLKRSISDVYARVSAGVHDNVSPQEAEHLFLTTYVLLGEVLGLDREKAAASVEVATD